MVTCPKCQADIDYLIVFSLEENKRNVNLDEKGNLDWQCAEPVDGSGVKDTFSCPVCNEDLFVTTSDAEITATVIPFLQGTTVECSAFIMKICEHENMRCPYCGSVKPPLQDKKTSVEGRPVHEVMCADCLGTFWVTCED